MDKFVILPTCSDLNRGDQALVWQTMDMAKKAGCDGTFYMLASDKDSTKQSQAIGIRILAPILKHPSRKFKSQDNNEYNLKLIVKWGSVAIVDLLVSLFLLIRFTRMIIFPLLPKNEKQTLKTIEESNACFVKGGGFIHSSGKITDSYTVYYQLFHILLAQSLNKPVYVMPNSFGPFPGLGIAWLVRRVLKSCKIVTVRETISKDMLAEIGIEAQLFPDLAFGLSKSEELNTEVSDLRKRYPRRQLVAITARPYRFPGSLDPSKKYKAYVENMIKFSKWLYEENCLPVFVEHTLSETTHENDGICIAEIITNLSQDEYAIISNKDYTCRDLKAIYASFDYIVGTRFHSVIFSLAEGIPVLAITYGGNKGQGIMGDLGLSDYAISMSEFDFKKAKHAFLKLCENRTHVCSQLAECNLDIEKSLCQLVNVLQEEIK
jgi:colanic acid/amylovoran biosynthesis protein